MKQENYDYLSKQVFYTGFGNSLDEKLKEQMQSGVNEFTLSHSQQIGKDEANTTLYFSQSEQGYYFFNKYDLALKKENAESVDRTFYIDKSNYNNYTFKESYNLLSGRAVNKDKKNKEQQPYNVWEKLDFTAKDKYGNYEVQSYGERYGFNLEKELSKLPIKGLTTEEDKSLFMDSIKRGNRKLVKLEENGELVERYVEANPKMRRMDVYDMGGNQINANLANANKKEIGKGKEQSEKLDASGEEGPKQLNAERKKDKGKKMGV